LELVVYNVNFEELLFEPADHETAFVRGKQALSQGSDSHIGCDYDGSGEFVQMGAMDDRPVDHAVSLKRETVDQMNLLKQVFSDSTISYAWQTRILDLVKSVKFGNGGHGNPFRI
jgi:hypothetical protein